MARLELFEYEKCIVRIGAGSDSLFQVEAIGPDRTCVFSASQQLVKFNRSTFQAALAGSSPKLTIRFGYPTADTMSLTVCFEDSLIGAMSETVLLQKRRELAPSELLEHIGSKLLALGGKQRSISAAIGQGRMLSAYVDSFGVESGRMGSGILEEEGWYDESQQADREIAVLTLARGTYTVTISMFLQALYQEYQFQFGRTFNLYGSLQADPNTGYSVEPTPILFRSIYTVEEPETAALVSKNFSNSPLCIRNCLITAELMKAGDP